MGGYLSVVIRTSSGSVEKMSNWTNYLPYFVANDMFFEENNAYIQNYINQMDSEGVLVPEGYGLVVLDFMSKSILSCQGYCMLERMSLASFQLEANKNKKNKIGTPKADALKRMIEKRMVRVYEDFDSYSSPEIIAITSFIQAQQLIDSSILSFKTWGDFILDPIGWSIIDYKEDWLGYVELKKKLIELNFTFTPSEDRDWERVISAAKEELINS